MKTFFGVDPPSPPAKGIVVTLEGTNLLLTIVLSTVALLALIAKATTNFNKINEQIRDLDKTLEANQKEREKLADQILDLQKNFTAFDKKCEIHINDYFNAKQRLLDQVENLQKHSGSLDKRFDVHLQDYVNHKDWSLLAINNCKELVEHKWERAEEEFAKDRAEIKDFKGFLIRKLDFRIRDDV